ncbi:transposase family protein [Micromonospora sp. NPDC005215]|uniref:transposase family protein n=1 Tax=Micromonospora sp. NPDC005215 TaxID=3157024 RepID=UPI0033B7DAF3
MLIAEVSHAHAAIIADLVPVARTGSDRAETAGGLPAALACLPDPRARRGVRYPLAVVVTAAVCAVVAGYRS